MSEQTSGPSWTPEDVELGADALARSRGYSNLADVEKVSPATAGWFTEDTRVVLAALAEAGRLREPGDRTSLPLPAEWACGAFEPTTRADLKPYRCTESSGHSGPHRAVMGLTVLAAWLPVETTDTPKEPDDA